MKGRELRSSTDWESDAGFTAQPACPGELLVSLVQARVPGEEGPQWGNCLHQIVYGAFPGLMTEEGGPSSPGAVQALPQ